MQLLDQAFDIGTTGRWQIIVPMIYRVVDVPDVDLPLPDISLLPEAPLFPLPYAPLLPELSLLPPEVPPDIPLLPPEVPPDPPLLPPEVSPLDMPLLPDVLG
jgi:hypothetical protein